MKSQLRSLRVDVPTLEPDPVFLGMLADLSASSRPTVHKTARSTGLRLVAAMASVAVVAGATWAAGLHTGRETPLSPAPLVAPTETGTTPSPGPTATPHSGGASVTGDSLSPESPVTKTGSEHAADPARPTGSAAKSHKKSKLKAAKPATKKKPGKRDDASTRPAPPSWSWGPYGGGYGGYPGFGGYGDFPGLGNGLPRDDDSRHAKPKLKQKHKHRSHLHGASKAR